VNQGALFLSDGRFALGVLPEYDFAISSRWNYFDASEGHSFCAPHLVLGHKGGNEDFAKGT
jgi:hypothetical protein